MLSTFGIDSRKKICIGSLDTKIKDSNANINKYWLYGDIEAKSLSSIKLEYKEHFSSAVDDYNKTYNDLTANLRNKLNTLIKISNKIRRGKSGSEDISNSTDGNSNSTRATLMELSAMLSELTGDPRAEEQFAEIYAIAPKYHIPQRESPPSISLPMSDLNNGLVVNFAFGKVGLFDAKKEVWDPITNIMNYLTPKPIDYKYSFDEGGTIDTGLYNFGNLNTVPFQVASKFRFYNRVFLGMSDIQKDVKQNLENKGASKETIELTQDENIFMSVTDALSNTKDLEKSARKTEKSSENIIGLKSQLKEAEEKGNTDKALKLKKEIEKAESRRGVIGNINAIIGQLATLDTKFIGTAIREDYKSLEKIILPVQIGFVPKNCDEKGFIIYGLDENNIANTFLTDYKPLITVSGIIEDLSCNFDFSDVDERGYPMKGSISINKLWPVETFGQNVSFG